MKERFKCHFSGGNGGSYSGGASGGSVSIETQVAHIAGNISFICLDGQSFYERKIVNIFFTISFNICFGCSKEPSH